MNNYYIDPTYKGVSTGTIGQPFKKMSELISSGITHPCNIMLRRGTTLIENADFEELLQNVTGTQSYITDYGSKKNAAPKWLNKEMIPSVQGVIKGQHITSIATRNLTIENIEFFLVSKQGYQRIEGQLPNDIACLSLRMKPLAAEVEFDANVWIQNCKITADNIAGSARRRYHHGAIRLISRESTRHKAHKFGVRDCTFFGLSRSIVLQGNYDHADDPTRNDQGTYYSQGVKVERCSFVRNGRGAVLFQGCESRDSAYIDNEWQSVCRDCNYSNYRWDIINDIDSLDATQNADAGFWTWRSNRVMIERVYGGGFYNLNLDCELFDFDYLSWDCVVRDSVSFNNAALILIMGASASGSQGAARTAYDSSYTIDEWFNDRRNGTGNNTIENCISFNDGINVNNYKETPPYVGCIKAGSFGTYNSTVKNCVFIDTVTQEAKGITNVLAGKEGAELPKFIFDNNKFLFKNVKLPIVFPAITANHSKNALIFRNNTVVSAAFDSSAITALLENINQAATVSALSTTFPDNFSGFPTQPPVSLRSAQKLFL